MCVIYLHIYFCSGGLPCLRYSGFSRVRLFVWASMSMCVCVCVCMCLDACVCVRLSLGVLCVCVRLCLCVYLCGRAQGACGAGHWWSPQSGAGSPSGLCHWCGKTGGWCGWRAVETWLLLPRGERERSESYSRFLCLLIVFPYNRKRRRRSELNLVILKGGTIGCFFYKIKALLCFPTQIYS